MDKEQEKQVIEKNLIDFYLSFKEDDFMYYYENDYVYNLNGTWPSFILRKNTTTDFLTIIDSINQSNSISKNWILDAYFVSKNKLQIKKENLFPVKKWSGMLLNTTNTIKQINLSNFKVERLKKNELNQFIEIINTSVFKSSRLSKKQLKNKLDNLNFYFFVGKYKDQIVSTCLLFDNGTTIGLYFIATKKEFRGKGFGKLIVSNAINHLINKGNANFVLHATSMGNSIYKNLGFKEYSKLIIFVKI